MNSIPRSGAVSGFAQAIKAARIPHASRRAFSASAACPRGALPNFHEPSSPELAAVLSQLNSRVLLPAHLTHEQELLVYKQKHRARLEAEPMSITLGDIELPLEHLDRNTDIPGRFESIKQVVELAQTREDWENVVRMLEGFVSAGIKIREGRLEKVVRWMFKAGQAGLVIRALERVRETGLSLKYDGVRNLVLSGLRDGAAKEGWGKKETDIALEKVERVVELMENKLHLGKSAAVQGDPRASPQTIAYLAELAAVRAKKFQDGKDVDGKVMKYAVRLMAACKQDQWMTQTLPHILSTQLTLPSSLPTQSRQERAAASDLRRSIISYLPLWNALQTSSAVLGARMPHAEDAKKIGSQLWKAINSARQQLEARKLAGHVKERIETCKV